MKRIMRALAGAFALPLALAGAGPDTRIASPSPSPSAPALTAQDLDTYLDGMVPAMLRRGDMAGAEVVVVKDGQVLFEKGYGVADMATRRPVDPRTTLFRAGSISKLFTWTAVMQLAEQGKLDLDADVNRYLDFKIPARDGKPITLRNLMTHRSGFEETFRSIVVRDRSEMPTLEEYIKTWTPTRIYAPGEVPAYSNYGATLAGYIVQRVSHQRFEDYVRDHIFAPLGMARATFLQDPKAGDGAATGYILASNPPHGYEYVGDVPAGALSISGDDMARFMLAHLGEGQWDGRRILGADSERRMLAPSFATAAGFNSMALGFYGENRNGRRVVGHAGDLMSFHADLHLLPDDHVGLYIAINSLGTNVSSSALREAVFRGFMDRYFPGPGGDLPTMPSARADGAKLVGTYENSRGALDTFGGLGGVLGQATMRQRPDGRLEFSAFVEPGGRPSVWREVRPMVWRNEDGSALMSATLHDGKVDRIVSTQEPPVLVWLPVPGSRSSTWILPLLGLALAVLVGATFVWPIRFLVRRALGVSPEAGSRARTLRRAASLGAVLQLGFLLGWLILIASASSDPAILSRSLDAWLRLLQLTGLVGYGLGAASVWSLVSTWRQRPRRWWSRVGFVALSFAWMFGLWVAVGFHLLSFSLHY